VKEKSCSSQFPYVIADFLYLEETVVSNRDKETGSFQREFCHRLLVRNGGFLWAFAQSKLTVCSKHIAAFDDATN
jgi:hypothetical protein